jgi:hypothetical protein
MIKNWIIKGLAMILMLIVLIITLPFAIFWNVILLIDLILVNINRRTKAGIKEVKKSDEYK